MKEFVVYTAARLGLFLGTYVVLALVWAALFGWDDATFLWPFVIALVISSLLSLRLLAGQREAFAQRIDERARKAASAFDRRRSREDDE